MTNHDRELLRPEDATSWEEFDARCTIEQAQCRAVNSSNKALLQTMLAALFLFGTIFFGAGVAIGQNGARWVFLPFALVCAWLFLRRFGTVLRRGAGGSKRYAELSRLRKQWQAKAERGEIPQTTPGGPKVWRDELAPEAKG